MTIIAVKKEKSKITLASDSQTTTGQVPSYKNKLFSVWKIHIWGAWLASESQILERFLKENWYDEKTIKNQDALFNLFSNFYGFLKKKWVIDSRKDWTKQPFNDFIIVVENLKKVYKYSCWYLAEQEFACCIWSGSSHARSILDETKDINKAIDYAKKYDIYCGWDTNILEIKI